MNSNYRFCVPIALLVVVLSCALHAYASPVVDESRACSECINLWNDLRHAGGCNGNSALCKFLPVSTTECQHIIDEICAYRCSSDPASCAQVACCTFGLCSGSACPSA